MNHRSTHDQSLRPVGRRALARGVAWTAPAVVLATPAPAYAVSCNQTTPVVVNWGSSAYTRNSDVLGTWLLDPDGNGTVYGLHRITVAATLVGNIKTGTYTGSENRNLVVSTGSVSQLGRCLQLQQAPRTSSGYGGRASRQEVTFTFTPSVQDLAFSFGDIDSQTDIYSDRVEILRTNGFGQTKPTGSTVLGSGTSAAPFRQPNDNTPVADDSVAGNVNITMPGLTSTLTVVYWSSDTSLDFGNPQQRMYISNLRFNARPNGC